MEKDIRILTNDFEVRNFEEGGPVVVGYALKFERESQKLGWFVETLKRGCLDNAEMDDVVLLMNHDDNYVLGRTGKNLKLEIDEIGLRFECSFPNTTYAKDLVELMRNGYVDKCSFAFTVSENGDEWNYNEEEDLYYRAVSNISRLFDVSIVTSPAYKDTEVVVSSRSRNDIEKMKKPPEDNSKEIELMMMSLTL